MNILYISDLPFDPWVKPLHRYLPDADLFVWGNDDIDAADVDYILVWKPPRGVLKNFPNAKAIFNLGAGVDALLQDPDLPTDIPIVRLVDPRLSSSMAEFIVYWVLHFHRGMHTYAQQQRTGDWTPHGQSHTEKRRVGILGLGELGQDAAHALLMLGFENIAGWSRSRKELPSIESFAGAGELDDFLARTEILVCLLPNTQETNGLLNAKTLAKLPEGAFIINSGRGSLLDEDDLIAALKAGHIKAVALDVFQTEPLSSSHAFWKMENVFVTPHIASLTDAESATKIIGEGIEAIEDGDLPHNVVDLKKGY
ncbi:MAG: glyoxylate/hydroxypyruvate reductase A [Rhodospirillaceae bacterium]|nr:MAG: glyoxylate/hydroxypyruvate reductase A [Rhodospirillaceae bacterium]